MRLILAIIHSNLLIIELNTKLIQAECIEHFDK